MDTDEMVRIAKELSKRGWKVQEVSDDDDEAYYLADNEYANLGDIVFPSDAEFIAHAPRTILALAEEVARLQARCAEFERNSADTLIEDLEQDVIAEMHSGEGRITRAEIAWNQALDWVLERLKTYRKE